jgi:hypothetical protein
MRIQDPPEDVGVDALIDIDAEGAAPDGVALDGMGARVVRSTSWRGSGVGCGFAWLRRAMLWTEAPSAERVKPLACRRLRHLLASVRSWIVRRGTRQLHESLRWVGR